MFEVLLFVNVHDSSLIFIASVILSCTLRILRTRSRKSSNFSFFLSKTKVLLDNAFSIVAACGCCWVAVPAIASAGRLMEVSESEF